MPKTIDNVKLTLKQRAISQENALTLRLGRRRIVLPAEVRTLASDDYMFVHIPAFAEVLKRDGSESKIVTTVKEADAARKSFPRKSRKKTRSGGKRETPEIPADVKDALSALPAGYKLGYDENGKPKLVKKRKRRSSK